MRNPQKETLTLAVFLVVLVLVTVVVLDMGLGEVVEIVENIAVEAVEVGTLMVAD